MPHPLIPVREGSSERAQEGMALSDGTPTSRLISMRALTASTRVLPASVSSNRVAPEPESILHTRDLPEGGHARPQAQHPTQSPTRHWFKDLLAYWWVFCSKSPGEVATKARFTQWTAVGLLLGWKEMSGRLCAEATTIGVVSALLAGLTFPGLLAPPSISKDDLASWMPQPVLRRGFILSSGLSVMCSVCCVILCTAIIMQFNICTHELDTMDLIRSYEFVAGLNVVSFNLSLIGLSITVWISVAYNSNMTDTLVFGVIIIIMYVSLFALIFQMYAATSLVRLKERFDDIPRDLGPEVELPQSLAPGQPATDGQPAAQSFHQQSNQPTSSPISSPTISLAAHQQPDSASGSHPFAHPQLAQPRLHGWTES